MYSEKKHLVIEFTNIKITSMTLMQGGQLGLGVAKVISSHFSARFTLAILKRGFHGPTNRANERAKTAN